ncbi:Protein of unknown function [Pyronema omphalodes CBS 100304]|uniref:Uncharacterized protein n=1 Tax=Pyronema omphalodes (strain CBS 100304) TaxID=1076935 RepID=U4LRU3_PYROM|nr:Protein of unknown function [Pyronema omphalodes CBS 100304]
MLSAHIIQLASSSAPPASWTNLLLLTPPGAHLSSSFLLTTSAMTSILIECTTRLIILLPSYHPPYLATYSFTIVTILTLPSSSSLSPSQSSRTAWSTITRADPSFIGHSTLLLL